MEPAFKVTGDARKGSVKATYASDRPCLRESAGGRKGGRKGIADREWGGRGQRISQAANNKGLPEKSKAFSNKQAGI